MGYINTKTAKKLTKWEQKSNNIKNVYVESGTCIKSEAAADRVHRSTIPVGRWLKHSQKTSQKQVHFKKSMITDTKVYKRKSATKTGRNEHHHNVTKKKI